MKKQIENKIGDDGCEAILRNAKYLTSLEVLSLSGNKYKNINRMQYNLKIK